MGQVRLCAVWPTENWLGSSMNHIQGWKAVWICYWHALEKGCLLVKMHYGSYILQIQNSYSNGRWTSCKMSASLLTTEHEHSCTYLHTSRWAAPTRIYPRSAECPVSFYTVPFLTDFRPRTGSDLCKCTCLRRGKEKNNCAQRLTRVSLTIWVCCRHKNSSVATAASTLSEWLKTWHERPSSHKKNAGLLKAPRELIS